MDAQILTAMGGAEGVSQRFGQSPVQTPEADVPEGFDEEVTVGWFRVRRCGDRIDFKDLEYVPPNGGIDVHLHENTHPRSPTGGRNVPIVHLPSIVDAVLSAQTSG